MRRVGDVGDEKDHRQVSGNEEFEGRPQHLRKRRSSDDPSSEVEQRPTRRDNVPGRNFGESYKKAPRQLKWLQKAAISKCTANTASRKRFGLVKLANSDAK